MVHLLGVRVPDASADSLVSPHVDVCHERVSRCIMVCSVCVKAKQDGYLDEHSSHTEALSNPVRSWQSHAYLNSTQSTSAGYWPLYMVGRTSALIEPTIVDACLRTEQDDAKSLSGSTLAMRLAYCMCLYTVLEIFDDLGFLAKTGLLR